VTAVAVAVTVAAATGVAAVRGGSVVKAAALDTLQLGVGVR
jgi:hypothetical protein